MKTIWILNHYAIPPSESGGTRHYDLAEKLVEKGYNVTIFASSFNHFSRNEMVEYLPKDISKQVKYNNVKFHWIKTPSYSNGLSRLFNIVFFSNRLKTVLNKVSKLERPDLIIGSSVHPLTALVGLNFSKKNNIKFYFEERDLWPQTFIDFGKISEKNPIAKILYRLEAKLYKESDKTIFLFKNASLYAYSKGLDKNKSIYLPNGYNHQRYEIEKKNTDNQVLKEALEKLQDKKICLYIGSFGVANNMEQLLDLVEKTKILSEDYHFLFIGDGNLKNEIVSKAKDKSLTNITFLNPIVKNDIPYVVNNVYCGLISIKDSPLYKWGMSMNKLYDYLSGGLPIFALTNVETLGEVELTNAVIKSEIANDLAYKLVNYKEYDKEYTQKIAYEKFSWDCLSERLIKEIEEI